MSSIDDLSASIAAAKETAEQVSATFSGVGAETPTLVSQSIADDLEQLQARSETLRGDPGGLGTSHSAISSGSGSSGPRTARSNPSNKEPNFSNALIPNPKLTEYALNINHPRGGGKARVIKSTTGLGANDAAEVERQIREQVRTQPRILGIKDEYGQRWNVDVTLVGPEGKRLIRTAWIKEKTGRAQLVTISFPPKGTTNEPR